MNKERRQRHMKKLPNVHVWRSGRVPAKNPRVPKLPCGQILSLECLTRSLKVSELQVWAWIHSKRVRAWVHGRADPVVIIWKTDVEKLCGRTIQHDKDGAVHWANEPSALPPPPPEAPRQLAA